MPERVWLQPTVDDKTGVCDGDFYGTTNPDPRFVGFEPYVPESRLREAEAERDALLAGGQRAVLDYMSHKSDRVKEENAALRAERDALQADLKAAQALEQLHLKNLDTAYADIAALRTLARHWLKMLDWARAHYAPVGGTWPMIDPMDHFTLADMMDTQDVTAARAILARVEGA